MTDEHGRFQIELVDDTHTLTVSRRNESCDVELPLQPEIVNGIAKLGDLDCRFLPAGTGTPETETETETETDQATAPAP